MYETTGTPEITSRGPKLNFLEKHIPPPHT